MKQEENAFSYPKGSENDWTELVLGLYFLPSRILLRLLYATLICVDEREQKSEKW